MLLNTNNLQIHVNEFNRVPFPAAIDLKDLPTFIGNNILAYIECKKCYASKFCKYRKSEGKCNIQMNAITNYIECVSKEINLNNKLVVRYFIQSAIKYGEYIFACFNNYGYGLDNDYFDFWEGHQGFALTVCNAPHFSSPH